MIIVRWTAACALALLSSCSPAMAQSGSSVQFPSGWAPGQSICTKQVDGTCVPVAAATPLPVTSGGLGAGADQVQGTAASGAADSGFPVKMGGVYNSALPTFTTGQRGDAQLGANGALLSSIIGSNGAMLSIQTANADDLATSLPAIVSRSFSFYFDGTNYDRQRGENGAGYVVAKGTATLATGQVSVTTSSTLVAAARAARSKITLNVGAANTCAFGNTGVTTGTGLALPPTVGASVTLDTAAAIYAACSSTTTVSFLEQY